MQLKYVNPYSFIATDYSTGMDAIATALAPLFPNLTIDDLVNNVYAFIVAQYFATAPDPLQEKSLKSTIYSVINGYMNAQSGAYLLYNYAQMGFVYKLLEGTIDCKNPEDIMDHILNVELQITMSGLSSVDQMPLLYATAIGKAAYTYWKGIINLPGNWSNFITSFAGPAMKFPFWIAASMEGALIGLSMSNATYKGQFAAELEVYLNFKGGNI